MKIFGCESLAVDTFLSWLSRKLKSRTQKIIIGEEDYNFIISDKNPNINSLSSLSLSSKSFKHISTIKSKSGTIKNDNLNIIKEEDEDKDEEDNENIKNEEINDKNEIDINEIINLINNKEHNIDNTITNIIRDYFENLTKSLEV